MEENKNKDLEDDEELKALRLAALATLKAPIKKEDGLTESQVPSYSTPINRILTESANSSREPESNHVSFIPPSLNAHAWRKQINQTRRRGTPYSKTSQRSNLIVISPVPLETGKDGKQSAETEESKAVGDKLKVSEILPQFKWCGSGTEDSMSPKTLRRTGPTRFNRHGSDSESSESDYTEDSDSDSGSNETVLQDEPREPFSALSPSREKNDESKSPQKLRRLSFHNFDSELKSEQNETTSVYNCLKNSNPSYNRSDSYSSVQSQDVSANIWDCPAQNNYTTYNQYSSQSYSTNPNSFNNYSINVNSDKHYNDSRNLTNVPTWQPNQVDSGNSYYTAGNIPVSNPSKETSNTNYYSRDTSYTVNTNNMSFTDDTKHLPQNDLRLELKKRMEDLNSKPDNSTNTHSETGRCLSEDNTRQNFQENDDGNNSYSNRNQQNRSYSRERYRSDHFSRVRECSQERERNYSLNQEKGNESGYRRNRYEESFYYKRHQNEFNFRERHDHRSSSRDRRSEQYGSFRDKSRHEQHNSSPGRGRLEHHSSAYEKAGHEQQNSSYDRSRYEQQNFSPDKNRQDSYISNQGRRRHEQRSLSRERHRRENRSSSRGRRHESHSSSRERSRNGSRSSSRDRRRESRSSSRHRKRRESRSSSRGRKRHESRSSSRDRKKHGSRSSSRDRKRHESRSSSRDRKRHESRSSSRDRKRHGSHSSSTDRKRTESQSSSHDQNRQKILSSNQINIQQKVDSRVSHDRSRSRERYRHETRVSKDKGRGEHHLRSNRRKHRYSSEDSISSERSSSRDSNEHSRRKHNRSSSQEKIKYEQNPFSKHKTELNSNENLLINCDTYRTSKEQPNNCQKGGNNEVEKSWSDCSAGKEKNYSEHSSNQGRNKHPIKIQSQDGYKPDHSKKSNYSDSGISKEGGVSSPSKTKSHSLSLSKTGDNPSLIQEKYADKDNSGKKNKIDIFSNIQDKHCTSQEKTVDTTVRQKSLGKNLQGRSKEQCGPHSSHKITVSSSREHARSRASSRSSRSSYSSSSSPDSRSKIRSIPSVVKSVPVKSPAKGEKEPSTGLMSSGISFCLSSRSDKFLQSKKGLEPGDRSKHFKSDQMDNDKKTSESNKRVPVHMRLGAFPRKRVLQMTKDVEAAFVNSSSSSDSESVCTKSKRQKISISSEICSKSETVTNVNASFGNEKADNTLKEKSRRLKTYR